MPRVRRWSALAAACASVAAFAQAPQVRPDGFQSDVLGRAQGYPACTALDYLDDQKCLVGAHSAFDTLFPARRIAAPPDASPLKRAPKEPEIPGLQAYLDSQPVTGFLLARGDTILLERYQYARTEQHRFVSMSMAKTITALLVGHALADGAIRSLDDPAGAYVAALADTEYGKTPLRELLRMRSGVAFDEWYTDRNSDIYTLARFTLQQGAGGATGVLPRFNRRIAAPGERFNYSSADSTVLALVVAAATKRHVADYAHDKIWAPLGAESDASWNVDANGQEIGYAYFNATLRDWARLGLMLAHGGAWNGRQVVPREFVDAATAGLHPGYGFQTWLLATARPTFALRGLRGQWVMVDPKTKLVLVQTAVRASDEAAMQVWRTVLALYPD